MRVLFKINVKLEDMMNWLDRAILFRDFDFSSVYKPETAEMERVEPVYRFNWAERWGNKLFTSLVISLEISDGKWAQDRCFLARQGLKVATLFALVLTCWLWIPGYVLKKCGELKNEHSAARYEGAAIFGKWFEVTSQIGRRSGLAEQLNTHLTSWGNWLQTRDPQITENLGQLIFGVQSTYNQAFRFGSCLSNCMVANTAEDFAQAVTAFRDDAGINQSPGFAQLRDQYISLIRDTRASCFLGLQYNELRAQIAPPVLA